MAAIWDSSSPGKLTRRANPKLDPILEEALFALQEGEISPIVQTESAFHILKAERVLDVYGEREIKLRRIDIAITASEDTESVLRELADDMLKRAHEGEPFEQLIHVPEQFADLAEPTLSEPNEGNGLLLNEMESSWRSAVRRLENPGDVIERRPITMPEGLYIFQLIEKEETPTFEALAEQFEAEWDTFYDDVMNPKPEGTEGDGDSQDIEAGESQDATEEAVSDKQSEVSSPSEIESSPGTESEIENQRQEADGDTPDTDEDQTCRAGTEVRG